MGQLIPENATRKIDGLGRITLPKGLRDRYNLGNEDDLELFTATIDSRQCICLAKKVNEDEKIEEAIQFLESKGYTIVNEE